MYYICFCVKILLVINMKKTLLILLSIIILMFSLSLSIFATDSVHLSLSNETVYAGDEFTLNLFISDNSKMSGAVIDINYDKDAFDFVSAKEGAILDSKANISIRNIKGDSSFVRFTYMSPSSSVTSEGILLSITFKAHETAKGDTTVKITIPNAADFVTSDLEKISYTVKDSKVTIINNNDIENTSEEALIENEVEDDIQNTEEMSTTNDENNITDNSNNKPDNDIWIYICLFVVGIALVMTGIIFAVKKKKE